MQTPSITNVVGSSTASGITDTATLFVTGTDGLRLNVESSLDLSNSNYSGFLIFLDSAFIFEAVGEDVTLAHANGPVVTAV